MLVYVYKSPKKQDTYLYLLKKEGFDALPKALLDSFGVPHFVMILPLNKREKLASVDKQKLVKELKVRGFYLQLPPPAEDMLKSHRQSQESHSNSEK